MNWKQAIREARERIQPHLRETYLQRSDWLSDRCDAEVYLKLENLQVTGSFKARGAANKLLTLSPKERARGVVTASTGNHGAAVAQAGRALGCPVLVFCPQDADQSKVAAIVRRGANVRYHGHDCVEVERLARRHAEEEALTYIPPYNDPQVIAGQGTIGAELLDQMPDVDAVFASVGGGGLIGGIAAYLKAAKPSVKVVGCTPENSQVMLQSVAAGEVLDLPSQPTLSDGTAGGLEDETMTFPLCRDLVDEWLTVDEPEIASALRGVLNQEHLLVEGAAAVSVAAYLRVAEQYRGQRVAIVVCGGNIGLETLRRALDLA